MREHAPIPSVMYNNNDYYYNNNRDGGEDDDYKMLTTKTIKLPFYSSYSVICNII